jgi:hypothetical protein
MMWRNLGARNLARWQALLLVLRWWLLHLLLMLVLVLVLMLVLMLVGLVGHRLGTRGMILRWWSTRWGWCVYVLVSW